MKKKQIICVGLCSILFFYATILKADKASEDIKTYVQKIMPSMVVDEVKETPIQGLYSVTIGPRIIYFSKDMNYMLQGSIINTKTMDNITELAEAKATTKAIDNIGDKNMINYLADNKSEETLQDTVTVFTDIDCGYCRKLHKEMDNYNELGINVRYMFMPRSGKNSNSYKKAVSVWCADDKEKAMDVAKSGRKVPTKSCENPIDKHMQLAKMLGINGTPSIILSNGELIPGYVSPDKLKLILAQARATEANKQSTKN